MQRTMSAATIGAEAGQKPQPNGQATKGAITAGQVQRSEAGVRVSLTISWELAGQTDIASSQDGFETMIELDILNGEIEALMVEQREAWRELARHTLTAFDRRELRNRIRQGEVELRDHLQVRTDRLRFRPRPVETPADSFANIEFRLF
jgi:hypothetical protein